MPFEIRRAIPEQNELLRDFQDPIEFMLLYISLYEQQLCCSTKVYLHQIPYFAKFQIDFLRKTLELGSEGTSGLITLDSLESVLVAFHKKPFYDEIFYSHTIEILFKGLNISLDYVLSEIMNGCYDNIGFLYKYLPYDIDLTKLIAQQAMERLCTADDEKETTAELESLADLLDGINRIVNSSYCISELIDTQRLTVSAQRDLKEELKYTTNLIKIEPPSCIIGLERVKVYNVERVLIELFICYKLYSKVATSSISSYNQLMRFSKGILDVYGLEELSNEVKEYGKYILVEDPPECIS
ncbi:hypothetical protein PAEPH01_2488 [Pancytospora epiphaga]|nr:hypothetical protein PAEPH01_2488 [Pancytospora epiphaga]